MTSKLPNKHPEYIQTLLNSLANNCQLTTVQYDSVIRYLSKQRNEQMNLGLGEDAPRPLCICGGRPMNILDLPHPVLKLIFSFLPAKDMVSIQMVCKPWKDFTMNALIWKHAPVDIVDFGHGEPFKILPYVPYLHTVSGYIERGSEFFEALTKNVLDLRRMDCCVFGFSKDSLENVLEKYKNIEFIEINNDCTSNFVEALDILSSCPKLRGLSVFISENNKDCEEVHNERFLTICNAIGNGFSTLRELDISCIKGGEYPHVLCNMLQKKINQLTHLSLNHDIHSDILEIIFRSTRLVNLEIDIPKISLNISNMIGLKSLTLEFADVPSHSAQPEEHSINVYKNLVFPRNLECLTLDFSHIECSRLYRGIISNITRSLPNLKYMDIDTIVDQDIDLQLEKIGNLQNLNTVKLHHCPYLTARGVEHITRCSKLRQLEFTELTFTDSTYEHLKNCTYLTYFNLHSCVLNPDKLLPAVLSMKYLTKMCLTDCKVEGDGTKIDSDLAKKIMLRCRREKHYVNIEC